MKETRHSIDNIWGTRTPYVTPTAKAWLQTKIRTSAQTLIASWQLLLPATRVLFTSDNDLGNTIERIMSQLSLLSQ